jgi:hypothetical protein
MQKKTTEKEKQALQNALTSFKINLDLHVKNFEDKRKAKKFFLQDGPKSVSPVLDYNQMNHFILGISEGMKIKEKAN